MIDIPKFQTSLIECVLIHNHDSFHRKVGMLLISPDGWKDGYPHHILQSMMKSGSGLERIATEEAKIRFPNFKPCTETELCLYKNAGYIRANKALQAFQVNSAI